MAIELTPELEALIDRQLATGRYQSRVEVIGEALALLEDYAQLEKTKIARLRTEIQKGIASGDAEPLDMDEIIAKARERFTQRNLE
mgnify:CR=1 FL=1